MPRNHFQATHHWIPGCSGIRAPNERGEYRGKVALNLRSIPCRKALMVDGLHHIINHRFAHRRKEMSAPGMTVGFFVVGGVFSEGFDQKQQVGGLG